MTMNLLSVIDLPQPIADIFGSFGNLSFGAVSDAEAVRPDVLLCSIRPYRFDRDLIAALPDSVRAIATYSVGHEHIDLEAATARGIAVYNTPGVLANAVADAALLLMLGAARRATESIAMLREGRWTGWSPQQLIGYELDGKVLGILGMGEIGKRIAARARGFGMTIAYHNRSPVADSDARYFADPRDLVAASDALVLAWPSTPATRHFINAETLALARPELIVINIGRGDLVRDTDLIDALRGGRILAAGLDVFENEPALAPGYLDLPNAFLLPHIGSSTWEARRAMAQILVDALAAAQRGERPANRIA